MRKNCFLKYTRYVLLVSSAVSAGGNLWGQRDFVTPTGEFNLFGGVSRYFTYPNIEHDPYRLNLANGALVGARGTWNFSNYFGLEGTYSYGWNNIRFRPTPGAPAPYGFIGFGSDTQTLSLGPVIYLTPPKRFRVFATLGVAEYIFKPTTSAEGQALGPQFAFLNASNLATENKTGGFFGIGIKGYFSEHFGLRADIDANIMGQPHLRMPSYAAVPGNTFVPNGGTGTLYQLTGGIFFAWGGHHPVVAPPPPPPPPPTPPPPPEPTLTVDAAGVRNMNAGCPGDSTDTIPLSVTAATSLPGHRPVYRWSVNGQTAGDNSPTFQFKVPPTAGTYRVGVAISDDPGTSGDPRTAAGTTREMLVATVREYRPPTISGSASPSEIPFGSKSSLTITPQGDDCNKGITYDCTVDQGTLTGTPPNSFDSTGMAFDVADRSRPQTRTATISCTVKDAKGGTGSTTIPVTVTLAPIEVTRLDDIIFSANNSRVNNCGKRILLEEVYPQLTQHPDWDLVLIGHTGPDDRKVTGKRAALDLQRALNSAATISAGSDTCPALESSRIRIALAGDEQTSDTRPGFCGTSARNAANERSGQSVSGDDPNAKFRRVEVYLVPKGAPLPAGATRMQVVPQSELKALGCPK